MGKLTGIYAGAQKGAGKAAQARGELIAGHGLSGDIHAGRDARRQVSFFAAETLQELLAEGFPVSAETLSANLFTENLALNALKPGAQLRIGETLIEIVEARKPCRNLTRIDKRLPKRLYGQCGQLGRIIKGGTVQAGDEIEILSMRGNQSELFTKQ